MLVYLNGDFVDEKDAVVPVTDRSFLYGDGCFEGIAVFNGRILHLGEHVERLFRSAAALRINLPMSEAQLTTRIVQTAFLNGMDRSPSGYLRPMVSRGSGRMGLKYSEELKDPTLVIVPQLGGREIAYGTEIPVLTAVTTSFVRPGPASLDPRIKSHNYLVNILAYFEARDRGCDVGLLRDDRGHVVEGHVTNIFVVRDNKLLTPPESAALAGITRRFVLQSARTLGYECCEVDIGPYDLQTADEVFCTSSLEALAAISSIDGIPVQGPVPGPVTRVLREHYVAWARETGTEVVDIAEKASRAAG
jgi:branched-chain amino acid aminotransferase